MGTNLLAELANLLDILILKVFFCQATIGFDQTPGKIRRTIAHELFNLIKHRSHLSWGEARMIEKPDKGVNGLLEVDIILPKGIVCIDQEMVVHFFPFFRLNGCPFKWRCDDPGTTRQDDAAPRERPEREGHVEQQHGQSRWD